MLAVVLQSAMRGLCLLRAQMEGTIALGSSMKEKRRKLERYERIKRNVEWGSTPTLVHRYTNLGHPP